MSKGSTARPLSVPKEQYDAAHARIFPPKPVKAPWQYVPPDAGEIQAASGASSARSA